MTGYSNGSVVQHKAWIPLDVLIPSEPPNPETSESGGTA